MKLSHIYLQLFRLNTSHTVCEKLAIHSLVCLLRSLLLTTCSVIIQTSLNIRQFFFTEWSWPGDHKNRCLSSSTNSVGLHFHEGVEKIKENDKNTNFKNRKPTKWVGKDFSILSMAGKTSCTGQKLKKCIISSNLV